MKMRKIQTQPGGVRVTWNVIIKEMEKWRYYLIALAWLVLMVFFTYTAILSDSMVASNSFESVHWNNQCTLISLIVNCGLLFMVVFDYMQIGKEIPHNVIWGVSIGMVLAIGIFGHAGILKDAATSMYKFPLNWTPLARYMHFAFLLVLLWLKKKVVELDMSEVEIVDDYLNN